jgi:hypothetical protein
LSVIHYIPTIPSGRIRAWPPSFVLRYCRNVRSEAESIVHREPLPCSPECGASQGRDDGSDASRGEARYILQCWWDELRVSWGRALADLLALGCAWSSFSVHSVGVT